MGGGLVRVVQSQEGGNGEWGAGCMSRWSGEREASVREVRSPRRDARAPKQMGGRSLLRELEPQNQFRSPREREAEC